MHLVLFFMNPSSLVLSLYSKGFIGDKYFYALDTVG
jgi:hypothetical protein